MDGLSSRFLDAFNAIENWMRHQLNASPNREFGRLVDEMADTPGFRRHVRPLKDFAEVRNFIAHRHSRDLPLAVPTVQTVERIAAIQAQLLSPPSLLSVAASPVEQCRPTDALGRSVQKMHDGVFSQLPIYDGEKCLGLLTAETIARWLANHLSDGLGLVEEKPIADVMEHEEDHDNYKFMVRTATVIDGLVAFEEFLHRGKRLEAILITHSGRPSEQPLGIVTIYDVPGLRRAIQE